MARDVLVREKILGMDPLDGMAPYSYNGTLQAHTGTGRFRFPFAATLLGVSAAVGSSPSGSGIQIDLRKNGTTVFPPISLDLPGTSGNYVETPDDPAFDIAGDIDLRCKVSMDNWTPGAIQTFICKRDFSTQNSYMFRMNSANKLELAWSADGSNILTSACTAATGYTDGTAHWIRVTMDVDDSGVRKLITFYTSEDGVAWTQLGNVNNPAGTTSIFNSTTPLRLGAGTSTTFLLAGSIYYAEVRDGIGGTVVATFDPTKVHWTTATTPSVVVQSGVTWTINGSGWSWIASNPRPTIANGTNATASEATPYIGNIAIGDYLTVDIMSVGSSSPGADLTVFTRYQRV